MDGRNQKERWKKDPKRYLNLYEHYYKEKIEEWQIEKVKETVYGSIENFFADIFETLCNLPKENFLCIEKGKENPTFLVG